jgi:SpoVK/Ycf46/Vps4 family AAA+-type ATPase
VLEHRRLLDLRQGVLFREWRQQDPSGRITRLNYLRLASLADRHVIVQSMPYERRTMQGTSRSRAVLVGGMAASAGRFDRQVLVDRPDRKGRLEILKVHVRKVQLERDIDLDTVAALTTGFTGADIANLVNEAAIVATRRNATAVSLEDFTEAIERIVA